MTTFDSILPALHAAFMRHAPALQGLKPIVINRDLNGRVRLIADSQYRDNPAWALLASDVCSTLNQHTFTVERLFLWESTQDLETLCRLGHAFELPVPEHLRNDPATDFLGIRVIDRLATESDWANISTGSAIASNRVVFFSIKGGVGRSTALAATAWALAEQGQRVLVLDMDLESPGLSSSLLPEDRRPTWGITDWLVEDLVNNGDAVLTGMVASSNLSRNGDIWVVPAHGREPGEYVSKLGRVWMPKLHANGTRQAWTSRLQRLIASLEEKYRPDVVLIDSRAGIDEVASACVTGLDAKLVLLFALVGEQTWTGYRMLFRHWHTRGVAPRIREQLQLIAAMLPENDTHKYLTNLRERGWDVFSEELYDEIPPHTDGETSSNISIAFNFDLHDEFAPHAPWPIRWNRGFEGLTSLHDRLDTVDAAQVAHVFGRLPETILSFISTSNPDT